MEWKPTLKNNKTSAEALESEEQQQDYTVMVADLALLSFLFEQFSLLFLKTRISSCFPSLSLCVKDDEHTITL